MTVRNEGQRQAVVASRQDGRVLWLCSDAAAFTVGHGMLVDGGQTA